MADRPRHYGAHNCACTYCAPIARLRANGKPIPTMPDVNWQTFIRGHYTQAERIFTHLLSSMACG